MREREREETKESLGVGGKQRAVARRVEDRDDMIDR